MRYPEDVKYTNDHEWVRLEGDICYIGITDFAQSELGEIVYVDVTTVGQVVDTNSVFGSIEAVKTVSDMYMPATGTVIEFNTALEDHPELVNEDPYGAGWIIKAQLSNPAQIDTLMGAGQYKEWVGK